MGTEIKITYFL